MQSGLLNRCGTIKLTKRRGGEPSESSGSEAGSESPASLPDLRSPSPDFSDDSSICDLMEKLTKAKEREAAVAREQHTGPRSTAREQLAGPSGVLCVEQAECNLMVTDGNHKAGRPSCAAQPPRDRT